jgi:DNA polymerase V
VLERTVRELNGYACLELEQIITPKKQIMASRSFGRPMTEIEPIAQAISSHIARGCEKLRQQHSVCQFLTVFIRTNPFQTQIPQYRQSKTIPLIQPSHNTFWLCKLGKQLLSEIFQPGFHYHKAGIMLSELSPEHQVQTNLFSNENQPTHLKQQRLMSVIDQINQQYGKHCLYLANRGTQKSVWAMQRNAMSSRYTTRWQELLSVH